MKWIFVFVLYIDLNFELKYDSVNISKKSITSLGCFMNNSTETQKVVGICNEKITMPLWKWDSENM